MDSPVTSDSSTEDVPETTSPSTGTRSPGLTTTMSPSASSSAATSASSPSRTTMALGGWRSMSFTIASDVAPLDLSSMYFPARTRVIMTADVC